MRETGNNDGNLFRCYDYFCKFYDRCSHYDLRLKWCCICTFHYVYKLNLISTHVVGLLGTSVLIVLTFVNVVVCVVEGHWLTLK